MTLFNYLARTVSTFVALIALGTLPALADDLQDVNRQLRLGNHEQALDLVNKHLSSKPKDPQARFLKGLILTEQNNQAEAIKIFTALTEDFPELPEPYNNLAVLYAAQGQYDKARSALETAIRTHPSYATAYENLGDIYAKLASQAYDKALQLDKSNTVAQTKLALIRDLFPEKTPPTQVTSRPGNGGSASAAAVSVPGTMAKTEKTPPSSQGRDNQSQQEDVLAAVSGWAKAWGDKEVDAYLAHYAPDFKVPDNGDRAAWEKQRRERISRAKSIEVAVLKPIVVFDGDSRAKVTFKQNYRSESLKSNMVKTLVMSRSNGKWLIQQERAGH